MRHLRHIVFALQISIGATTLSDINARNPPFAFEKFPFLDDEANVISACAQLSLEPAEFLRTRPGPFLPGYMSKVSAAEGWSQ